MEERSVELSSEDVDILSNMVTRLGSYGETLFDNLDLGITRSGFMSHVNEVLSNLSRLKEVDGGKRLALRPPGIDNSPLLDNLGDTWNYIQTLRFAAGATMITQKYLKCMSKENLRKSMIAKILYKCQTGIMDDLIDIGRYSYIEAKDLYHHVLSSMTSPDFELNAFKKKLITMMKQEQLSLFDIMTEITASFNKIFMESPHGHEFFYQMEVLDERVILGQALTMFQKEPSFDINKIKKIASRFYAPSQDLKWYDRMANYVSGGTRYNLIDMSFCDKSLDFGPTDTFLEGWYYYDVVIVYLNNIVHIYQDLRGGIANLSLTSIREKDISSLSTLKGYNPRLTINDYTNHLCKLARLASRALKILTNDYADETLYYPFITVMMPIVMMADWIGKQDSFIDLYLRELSPELSRVATEARERFTPEAAEAIA
ncbi:MAG: hypothetical protein ACE5QW_08005 [Thermoplasmata archaeon]